MAWPSRGCAENKRTAILSGLTVHLSPWTFLLLQIFFPLNSELTDNLNFLLVLETFTFTSSSFRLLLIKHSLQIVCFQSETMWSTICTAEKGKECLLSSVKIFRAWDRVLSCLWSPEYSREFNSTSLLQPRSRILYGFYVCAPGCPADWNSRGALGWVNAESHSFLPRPGALGTGRQWLCRVVS